MAIAVATPPALVVTGFRALANEWFVAFEYDRPGFPPDRYGLTRDEREELALVGLESIRPGTEGIALLEAATLPDGSPAFDERERGHMADVRSLFGAALRFQLIVLLAVVAAAVALARSPRRTLVPRGVLAGSLTTIGVAALAVPVILLGFDGFFTRFHEVFFDGDSWRFSTTDTLIRLYPERFWEDTAMLVALVTVAQAVALAPLAWWWQRRAARAGAREPA